MLPLNLLPCAAAGADPELLQEPGHGTYDYQNEIGEQLWLYNIAKLVPPTLALTSLHLDVDQQDVGAGYWLSLACHTQLQSLRLAGLSWSNFGVITAMAACRQLTQLELLVSDYDHAHLEMQVRLVPVRQSGVLPPAHQACGAQFGSLQQLMQTDIGHK